MNADVRGLVDLLSVVVDEDVLDELREAIAEDREKAYREGLKDGYETAKGIYDHTGRAA